VSFSLTLLGYRPAVEWQRADVLGADPPARAYSLAGTGNFSFGLVEGDFNYIYDFQRGRAKLYNLATDPAERNLASDYTYTEVMRDRSPALGRVGVISESSPGPVRR
jgi:hypothetical protein